MRHLPSALAAFALILSVGVSQATPAGQYRLLLRPEMLTASAPGADFSGLVDEQLDAGDPPSGKPAKGWKISSQLGGKFPFSCTVDLGKEIPLATFWLFDTHNKGEMSVQTGKPGAWQDLAAFTTDRYMGWRSVAVDRATRYLRIELKEPAAIFTEIALDAYSPAGWQALQTELAEKKRLENERQAALAKAREEALKRPMITMEPYGRLSLVDEILCAEDGKDHMFDESPKGASKTETILGQACRVVPTVDKRGSYISYRIGQRKLLRAGGVYVLAVEYPEDAPRSMIVVNTGNETSRGFNTGLSLGDAMHPKYVNNNVESLNLPLSGKWEQWTLLTRLHDRFPAKGMHRGAGVRPLKPKDGFDVVVCQFPTSSLPLSKGIAVRAIRLYEVVDPEALVQPINLPPKELPHRRLFWREEMADGVIGDKDAEKRGLTNDLDWYRNKADLMKFLGMNTYSKDLLEFGACQHWDPSPKGGNEWVYHDGRTKGFWAEIVAMMGEYGFDVLPYYEYSGSKGSKGLGFQRRCKPLTRDDAYTHIKWIESANADITDPDTYADFKKMLDCTVLRFQSSADFAGIWIRPRSQLPIGFGDSTRERFAEEANGGKPVSRDDIKADPKLYARYIAWWDGKRRDFFAAMRDYLRENGVEDAQVLFTGCPAEPGVGFGSWDARFVTDTPQAWSKLLQQPEHLAKGSPMEILTPAGVADQGLYLQGLLSAGLTWGGWEGQHARPADDPDTYRNVPGIMLSHAFNRLYTVSSPETFDRFRSPAGLTIVRHYTLNENMMFDEKDKELIGYFIADIERAGPYCMLGEATAMANGDPTQIGYLVGGSYARGFPLYARDFNANFLALPALPSKVLPKASSDPDVVVRAIETPDHGTYLAVVNTGFSSKEVRVRVPGDGNVVWLATRTPVHAPGGQVSLTLRPCELVALGIGTK